MWFSIYSLLWKFWFLKKDAMPDVMIILFWFWKVFWKCKKIVLGNSCRDDVGSSTHKKRVSSKRWIEKWTLITKVELDDTVFYSSKKKKSSGKQRCFINFVNRVLLLTGTHFVIHLLKQISFPDFCHLGSDTAKCGAIWSLPLLLLKFCWA